MDRIAHRVDDSDSKSESESKTKEKKADCSSGDLLLAIELTVNKIDN